MCLPSGYEPNCSRDKTLVDKLFSVLSSAVLSRTDILLIKFSAGVILYGVLSNAFDEMKQPQVNLNVPKGRKL